MWRPQILVLGFCDSQSDLEVVQKILSQAGSGSASPSVPNQVLGFGVCKTAVLDHATSSQL